MILICVLCEFFLDRISKMKIPWRSSVASCATLLWPHFVQAERIMPLCWQSLLLEFGSLDGRHWGCSVEWCPRSPKDHVWKGTKCQKICAVWFSWKTYEITWYLPFPVQLLRSGVEARLWKVWCPEMTSHGLWSVDGSLGRTSGGLQTPETSMWCQWLWSPLGFVQSNLVGSSAQLSVTCWVGGSLLVFGPGSRMQMWMAWVAAQQHRTWLAKKVWEAIETMKWVPASLDPFKLVAFVGHVYVSEFALRLPKEIVSGGIRLLISLYRTFLSGGKRLQDRADAAPWDHQKTNFSASGHRPSASFHLETRFICPKNDSSFCYILLNLQDQEPQGWSLFRGL